ncbi:phosphoribosyltransferase [Inquilinus sp. OTU3971]|uniref:phosphoribosyltransferase n=1 Tax=Inquilinus sp. OTU3971 TaxID=3043855 RepID=UPI00313AA681
MPFADRSDAGHRLALALGAYRTERPVVLALPRGGVPVAAEVAAALDAPLELILVRKIGVPIQPELAMGAVVDGDEPTIVGNDTVIRNAGVSEAMFRACCQQELAEIARRRKLYLTGHQSVEVAGRVAIVIDDGIATGATARAALQALRQRRPKRLVLAAPVGPFSIIGMLRSVADEVIFLEDLDPYGAIGNLYGDFRQVSDQEVIEILARFSPRETRPSKPAGAR